MKKIIVAHPEKQHSHRLAKAVYSNGMLEAYITMVYYKHKSVTKTFEHLLRGRLNLTKSRRIKEIPDEKVVQYYEVRGLLLLILRRTKFYKLINWLQNSNFDKFGQKVAEKAIKNNVDAVVMYDTNSLACFKQIKSRHTNIKCIMDTSIANRFYTKYIYEQVVNCEKDWERFSESAVLLKNKEMERLLEEIKLTDYFLVPSQFVKRSLMYSGVSEEQIYIVPYGVDAEMFCYTERRNNINEGKLKLLFVGQCSYRKGINYLLEAAADMEKYVELTIAGGYERIQDLYDKFSAFGNIHFLGRIEHSKLPEVYSQADVFVLPSLSEGMSLVGLEAMACGLPLLCSENCGVNDVVKQGENGWILGEITSDSIKEKLLEIEAERHEIVRMGRNARLTAETYNWETYEKRMQYTLNEIVGLN